MWAQVNPNSNGMFVGDCVVRALAIALDKSWDKAYIELCIYGFIEGDMPSANHVWGKLLEDHGFVCEPIKGGRVKDIASQLKHGTFILATGAHVVTVIDGDYYDAWDSGDEIPTYIWRRKQ
jgi:hypothetical protein